MKYLKITFLIRHLAILMVMLLAFSQGYAQQNTGSPEEESSIMGYSTDDLSLFKSLRSEVLTTQRQYRRAMIEAVKSAGLDPDQFYEMTQYGKDVQDDESTFTAEEKSAYAVAMNDIIEIQEELSAAIRSQIKQAGIKPSLYYRIASDYERSKDFRQQVLALERQ